MLKAPSHSVAVGARTSLLRLGHVSTRQPPLRGPITAALRSTAATLGIESDALLRAFSQHWDWRPAREQKGVDVLLALDLVRLAQRRVYETAVLISGDRDLAEAVRTIQDEGVRVVLGYPTGGGVAPELKQLADVVLEIPRAALALMVEPRGSMLP